MRPRRAALLAGVALALLVVSCDSHRDPISNVRPGSTVPAANPESRAPSRSMLELGALEIRLEAVSSRGLVVTWDATTSASGYAIYLSPRPVAFDRLKEQATLLTELPAQARSYEIAGLGAGAHVFVTVVAKGSPNPAWGAAHRRLPGGPEAELDAPLESYHLVGPSVLGLVIRENTEFRGSQLTSDHGEDWQTGRWSVERADGRQIEVLKVFRRSSPRGLRALQVGFGKDGPRSMQLEHRVYLELGEAVGSEELLRVAHEPEDASPDRTHPTALDSRLPLSDLYTETPVVQVNQVGYNARARTRYAYVYEWLGDGGELNLANFPEAVEVLRDHGARRDGVAWLPVGRSSGPSRTSEGLLDVDLSSVAASEDAVLRVRVPGVGVSVPTQISESSAREAFVAVARGLHFERRCEAFTPEDGGVVRPRAHCEAHWARGRGPRDGFFPADMSTKGARVLEGGHYDAADFDIRPYHVLVAQYLLRAFELAPGKFTDGQFHAAARKNGVPDLLDEALHSLKIWEGLQDADGGVRQGIESTRHPWGYYYAHQDQLEYFTYDAEAGHTALVAGLFAQAAFLVKPFDAERSRGLQDAARRAYAYAKKYDAPAEYLIFPAGELARLDGGSSYVDEFERFYRSLDRYGRGAFDHMVPAAKIYPGSFSEEHPAMADYVVGYATSAHADPAIRAQVQGELDHMSRAALAGMASVSGHRSAKPDEFPPDWGQFVSQGRHFDGVYQRAAFRPEGGLSQDAIDAMSLAADALFGCNAAGMSYVTGLGSVYPRQALHLDSLAAIAEGKAAVPGIVVFGPVTRAPKAHYYEPVLAAFYPSFEQRPQLMRYADSALSVVTNEFSVWETQAPTVLLLAALLPEGNAKD